MNRPVRTRTPVHETRLWTSWRTLGSDNGSVLRRPWARHSEPSAQALPAWAPSPRPPAQAGGAELGRASQAARDPARDSGSRRRGTLRSVAHVWQPGTQGWRALLCSEREHPPAAQLLGASRGPFPVPRSLGDGRPSRPLPARTLPTFLSFRTPNPQPWPSKRGGRRGCPPEEGGVGSSTTSASWPRRPTGTEAAPCCESSRAPATPTSAAPWTEAPGRASRTALASLLLVLRAMSTALSLMFVFVEMIRFQADGRV